MTSFRHRRYRNVIVTVVALCLYGCLIRWRGQRLLDVRFASGYVLLACCLALLAFHWRKRLSFLPLGNASTWMQFHIYAGLSSLPLYLGHVGFTLPQGRLETVLALLFGCTFISGVLGLYVTRTYPQRLTNANAQALFDHIPAEQHRIARHARQLVVQLAQEPGTATLAQFYQQHLCEYFERPRGLRFTIRPGIETRRQLMAQLANVERYFSEREQRVSEQMFRLIRQKDDLDYQQALQLILRGWIFVHLSLSYALVIVGSLHGALAFQFSGDAK